LNVEKIECSAFSCEHDHTTSFAYVVQNSYLHNFITRFTEMNFFDPRIHILVIGNAGVGKSTIVDVLINRNVTPHTAEAMEETGSRPVTYFSDKYVITDTRPTRAYDVKLTADVIAQYRDYLEQVRGGYDIVLAVFTAITLEELGYQEYSAFSVFKEVLPELCPIMHVVLTNTSSIPARLTDDVIKQEFGVSDFVKVDFPPWRQSDEPVAIRYIQEKRRPSLAILENYIETHIYGTRVALSIDTGRKVREKIYRIEFENFGVYGWIRRNRLFIAAGLCSVVVVSLAFILYAKRRSS